MKRTLLSYPLEMFVLTLCFSTAGHVFVLSKAPVPSAIDSLPVTIGVTVGSTLWVLYSCDAVSLFGPGDTPK